MIKTVNYLDIYKLNEISIDIVAVNLSSQFGLAGDRCLVWLENV